MKTYKRYMRDGSVKELPLVNKYSERTKSAKKRAKRNNDK